MTFQSKCLLALTALATSTVTHAAIQMGQHSQNGAEGDRTAELFLIVWDPILERSYIKDLGVHVGAMRYDALGDTANNLFVYGQQNTGIQKFFDPLNDDQNFLAFLNGSNRANQLWGIFGASVNIDDDFAPGAYVAYTTLQSTTLGADGMNPQYLAMKQLSNNQLKSWAGAFPNIYIGESNIGACAGLADNTSCVAAVNQQSSSFRVKGEIGYAGNFMTATFGQVSKASFTVEQALPNVLNPIGSSSWFYTLAQDADPSNADAPIVIDEFDNGTLAGGNDAYWGLGVDSNGKYILSYTLAPSLTPALTAEGQLMRLRTDFTAQYGSIRFIDVPAGDTLSLGSSISPVPEPATWGLMGLGLAMLAARARRRA